MEGPGGYQFVGRTLQMWNRYRQSADFRDGKQWLLRFFDQIRFYPVSKDDILRMREDFILGRLQLRVEDSVLKLRDYNRFLQDNTDSIAVFKQRQQAAFDAERERWEKSGQAQFAADLPDEVAGSDAPFDLPAGCIGVASPVTGSVWAIPASVGERVAIGDDLVVVEAMKMEIAVEADEAGTLRELLCTQGMAVKAGQVLAIVQLEDEASD
jgi:urea carboxylase